MSINPDGKSLTECNELSPELKNLNIDLPPDQCGDDGFPNQRRKSGTAASWLEDVSNKKTGLGSSGNCDPVQSGQLANSLDNPNRNIIHRHPKAIRAVLEAMLDLFGDIFVLDEDGKSHKVPLIHGSQEKAVAWILQENVRKDNSLVVDRIRLPMMSLWMSDIQLNMERYTYHRALDYARSNRADNKPGYAIKERYERDTVFGVSRGVPVDMSFTLGAWTGYMEDMEQIITSIYLKSTPDTYINVRGVSWQSRVKLLSTSNLLDTEPGDQNLRIIKYEFNFVAETYIPQPIIRNKAVLKTRVDVFGSTEQEATGVLDRLEETSEELE